MHTELCFGKYDGETFEWVILNDLFYARWLKKKSILSTRHDYDANERYYFLELIVRASHLAGTCQLCMERQMTRLAIIDAEGEMKATPCCNECKPANVLHFAKPSLLIADKYGKPYPASVSHSILEHYLGPKQTFTQEDMEAFFRNDTHFVEANPNFFIDWEWV